MKRLLATIAIASALGMTGWGDMSASAQERLNGQQAMQFLTSKTLRTTDGTVAEWRRDGTYTMRRGSGRPFSGTYRVDADGRVCWRSQNGSTGCYVVFRDGQGYGGQGGGYTWHYR
jgi:hypothetical protein